MDAKTFEEVYDCTDVYVTRTFEGIQVVDNTTFNDNTYLEMRSLQKIDLTYMFSKSARRLAFSKLMRKPMEQIQDRVDELLGKDGSISSPLRYAIYSAHDDQISNMMEWLSPINAVQNYVLYAAQVVFELKYDSECLESSDKSEDCFFVNTLWNGIDL